MEHLNNHVNVKQTNKQSCQYLYELSAATPVKIYFLIWGNIKSTKK